jgi:predicted unusual protein kinase regulating ubiquinone biosynthesis (AarF/ABC1/UbiB family)
MHGGNVFYDRTTKRMQVIDFGLAQVSHKAALAEALSTNNGDWQSGSFITRWKPPGDEPEAYVQLRKNQRAIIRILEDRGYEPDRLGIRMKSKEIDEVLEEISESDARTYLKTLYKNV